MSRSALAKAQIQSARQYTLTLLEGLDADDWFAQPHGVSHIAWQCGHLTMAQYALTMIRIRGKEPEDAEFITSKFFKFFKKGSQPDPDPEANPPLEEILGTMNAVHEQALLAIDGYSDELLAEELPEPYSAEPTKLGSLLFCSAHEMLHAGQIGLIRRLLGKPAVR